MNFFIWSGLYSFVANLFIGAFVLLRNPRDKTSRLFALFSLLVSGWSVGSWLENILPDKTFALWILRTNYLFGIWVPSVYLHFVHTLSRQTAGSAKYFIKIGYVISGFLSLFVFTPYFIPRLRLMDPISYYISYPGPIYYLFFIFFAVCMIEILRFTFIEMRDNKSIYRSTFHYLALANCLAVFAGFEYFSRVFNLLKTPPIDDYVLVVYVLVLAFAIARHRLFDFDTLVHLIQREKLAAVGLLAAGINHEIKSPLFVIKGHAELLLEGFRKGDYKDLSPEKARRLEQSLEKTVEQANRVVEITKRLTDFSKPASAAGGERVNLNEAVENVLSFVGYGLRIDNVTVEKLINPALTLQANPKEMEQVFLNLILNACQALEKRSGKITIEAREKEGRIEIEITDTGPGIPPDKLKAIFEPFFTTKESGTGLGLYITKQLVERNKGKISAESKMGEGTTFLMEFRKSI